VLSPGARGLMSWILILYFNCGANCGEPVSLTLPFVYVTEQECTEAGNVWLSPKANPMRTVASFACNYVRRPKVFYFHNEQYQE
jgi:hypothetical protein